MHRCLLLIIILGLHFNWLLAQTNNFTRIYQAMPSVQMQKADKCPDNGFITLGDGSTGLNQIKTDSLGNVEWAQSFALTNSNYISILHTGIIACFDGGFLISAAVFDQSFDSETILIKTDSLGDTSWIKIYDIQFMKVGSSMVMQSHADSNFVFTGVFIDNFGISRIQAMKVDQNGNFIWARLFQPGLAFGINNTHDNQILISSEGFIGSNPSLYFIKLDQNGNLIWAKSHSNPVYHNTKPRSTVTASDGTFLVSGDMDEIGSVPIFLKLDSTGNIMWSKQMAVPNAYGLHFQLMETENNNFLSSYFLIDTSNVNQYYLSKFDQNGNHILSKTLNTPNSSISIEKMILTNFGKYAIFTAISDTSQHNELIFCDINLNNCRLNSSEIQTTPLVFFTSTDSYNLPFSVPVYPFPMDIITLTVTDSIYCSECLLDVTILADYQGKCNNSATANVMSGTPPFTYLWNDPLAQTTQTATNLCDGNYTVTVTDSSGCSAVISVTVSGPNSITGNEMSGPYTIFPNPFHENFTLEGSTPPKAVTIYQMTGSMVYFETKFANSDTFEIHPGNLDTGVYLVKIDCETFIQTIKLFVE